MVEIGLVAQRGHFGAIHRHGASTVFNWCLYCYLRKYSETYLLTTIDRWTVPVGEPQVSATVLYTRLF